MNNKLSNNLLKLCFVVFVLGAVLVISVLLLTLKRPDYSENENRELAKVPKVTFKSLISGAFFSELQLYYNDTIPGRDDLKEMGNRFVSYKGVQKDDMIIYRPPTKRTQEPDDEFDYTPVPFVPNTPHDDDDNETPTPELTEEPTEIITETPAPTENITLEPGATELPATDTPVPTAVPSPTPTPAPTKTPAPTATPDVDNDVQWYDNNGAVVYKWRGMELFGGSRKSMAKYVAAMEHIKSVCPNLNVYSMTVPIASMYYLPPSLQYSADEQLRELRYLQSLFTANNVVKVVDAYEALKPHINEDIFYRTDHHWTHLGAYYCTKAFAEKAGVPYTDISQYTAKSRDGFVGSFYSYFKMYELKNHPETVTYYISPHVAQCTASYYNQETYKRQSDLEGRIYFEELETRYTYSIPSYFDDVMSITTGVAGNGRALLIIKDSYGDPIPSFLLGSFDKIVMIDPRYFKLSLYDLIEDQGITDVLGIANVFNHSTNGFVKLYEAVIYQR